MQDLKKSDTRIIKIKIHPKNLRGSETLIEG